MVARVLPSLPAEPSWPQVRPEQDLQQGKQHGPPDHPLEERLFAEWVQASARPAKPQDPQPRRRRLGRPVPMPAPSLAWRTRSSTRLVAREPERQDKP